AAPAVPLRRGDPVLRAALPRAELAACRGVADRGDPGAGPTHRDQHPPDHRALPRAAVHQLPSHAEPRRVERAGSRACAAGPAAGRLRAEGAGDPRCRRHHRAPARQADRRQRRLPRPRALVEGPLREGERPALAQPDAAGPHTLGGTGLGAAVPDRARTLGTPLPRARPAPQEADRLGAPTGPAGPALDAGAAACAGGRQRLRRPRTPGRPRPPRGDLRHPSPPRCRPLRAGAAAPARGGRSSADQGGAPADPVRGPRRRGHAVAAGGGAGLVRRRRAGRGDPLRHRRLAPCRAAGRADPLGAAARPRPPVRPAGPAVHRPGPGSRADRPLVRPALAAGGHLPGGARPPRGRDPAPMVG
ncbi:MAG: hypothetical protein AVDCRST_MAG13-3718, partial [uncultured Solirubrobacteraceae bacterium]